MILRPQRAQNLSLGASIASSPLVKDLKSDLIEPKPLTAFAALKIEFCSDWLLSPDLHLAVTVGLIDFAAVNPAEGVKPSPVRAIITAKGASGVPAPFN